MRITRKDGYYLIIITIIAITIRTIPLLLHSSWGSDFGIYYGLTNSFVETKQLINPYDGWGSTYQYFPVLYVMAGALHWITGISTKVALGWIAPIMGGLTITILYFVVRELFRERKIAFISSILLATSILHIYQTSHAAPLVVGHFFMLLSIYFYIKYIKQHKYFIPLALSSLLLILSHHFTTYFYILTITIITFFLVADDEKTFKRLLIYLASLTTVTFLYWAYIATPVYEKYMFMFNISPIIIIIVYYIGITVGYFMFRHRHIITIFKKWERDKIRVHNKHFITYFTILITIAFSSLIITYYSGVPLTITTILISIPSFLIITFSFFGYSYVKKMDNGRFIIAWTLAILTSFIVSISADVLYPDRHLEYLIIPICIAAAIGLYHIKIDKSKRLLIISFIIISNTLVAYPTIETLEIVDEGISEPCFALMEWMQGNVSNTSVIMSDHRLSVLAWSYGFNSTFDSWKNIKLEHLWVANTTNPDVIKELKHFNITHIIIDCVMHDTVVNVAVGNYDIMTNTSYNKFKIPPFILLYRNATYNEEGEETYWAELYEYKNR